jgi:hypothetical protein
MSWPVRSTNDLFRGLTSLETLYAQENKIKSVKGSGFEDLRSLRYLNLSENPLTTLDENVFRNFESLEQLFLNSSKFTCDCHLAWFPSWIKEMNFTLTVGGLCRRGGQNIVHVSQDRFSCANYPKIIEMPQNKKANKSGNVTLRCKAESQSSNPMQYMWRRNGMLLVASDRIMITEDASGTSLLTIVNVDYTDGGSYQCRADNGIHYTDSRVAKIVVYKFPEFTTRPEDMEVREGGEVSIHCTAEGVPKPQIKIISTLRSSTFPAAKEGRIGYDDKRGAYIRNVSNRDEGLYFCTATNLAGTATANFQITILPPLPVVLRGSFDISGIVGQQLVMQCNTSGLKVNGNVAWYKDGEKQQPTGQHIQQTQSREWLILSSLESHDTGLYKCQLETENNYVETRYNLKVHLSDSNESGSPGNDDDATWIVISLILGIIFTSATWVIGIAVWRIMVIQKKNQRKLNTTGSSQSERPSQHANGHSRPVTMGKEVEEGSSGSGGLPVRIISTLKPVHNGLVGGKLVPKNGHRPAHASNGTSTTSQNENYNQSHSPNLGILCNVTSGQHEVSPCEQEALAIANGPQVRVLSPDEGFQPLVGAKDSGTQVAAASSKCNSDSDVD